MALTEKALFELKQGFCRLSRPPVFDDASFDKILCTASAMANTKAGARGVIFIGVADDKGDAESIERLVKIRAYELNGFYVTGTQHELDALSRSPDEHFRWLIDRIKASALDPLFADRLASTLMPFRYNDYLLWKLEPMAGNQPVAFDGKFYERQGPRTVEVSDPNRVIELVRRFTTVTG
jgi:predicted HTH transcriptional regulator